MHPATRAGQAPGQPTDPRLHVFAMRLSYRLVGIIQATLRPDEIHDAAAEFYRAIVADTRDYEQQPKP